MKPGAPLRRVPLARRQELPRTAPLEPGRPWARSVPLTGTGIARAREPKRKSAATGRGASTSGEFSAKVKLQCRTRAGNGDPDQARCECCGCWLGRHGGQVQHRLARGDGGSRNPLVRSLANAALLCGTAQTLCHGDAESRDPERDMEAKGYVIRHGKGLEFDPRYVPIALQSQFGSGMRVWLAEDGIGDSKTGYLYKCPEVRAA